MLSHRLLSLLMGLLISVVWLSVPFARADEQAVKRIGVLDFLGGDHSLRHWGATAASLDAAFPQLSFELVALDIDGLDKALAENRLDFVITNPGNYAELEYRYHISRIATAQEDQPVASTLVTNKGYKDLADLVGKRLAVVTPEAFGGFQIIWAEMDKVDPSLSRRVEVVATGYPMQKAVNAVLSGDADAAVLRTCTLEYLQAEDPDRYGSLHGFGLVETDETDCVVSSPLFPNWPFAKTRKTDSELAKEVAVTLMSIKEGNLWTVPLDYQSVHAVLRRLEIGPYARTGLISLADFIEDYSEWLLLIACALIFWAIYSVRIENLVRRRTRALNETNEQLVLEIAERKRAEEADRMHRRELEHVARLSILGEMATSIAHELNQPLAAISNYAQGCAMRISTGRFTQDDMEVASNEIAQQAERAASVIRRIRAFVRNKESQKVTVGIAGLIADCAPVYEASAHRAGVAVEVTIAPGLPTIEADRIQLQQVILNLVQNAIDAMIDAPADQKRVRLNARRASGDAPGIVLSLRDFGHGMDEEGLGHFAEAFYTTKENGIGLGLALSRSIVEAHGGTMRAEAPSEGPGLVVILFLPTGDAP
ncbi:two-component system, LuxR family, sensor histidine kinase TtrS [Cohaesibacter sp. ES.047]|uniref:sensor histidine kinase n=1 Tax=Cohaesibacter sp. ES.047 TaxID=1798205 RepID=UPI000BB87F3A|nr:PhnD/SsuA/transferrin family substrate-binding protein [Cohaesibacter sp. ES.047]SNY92592.1 two-component system, LuxR family, sensor histidine kinase TtrS [Cohaesibacter sp. ES.047]